MFLNGLADLQTYRGEGVRISFESLKAREDEFVRRLEADDKKFDSSWENGAILKDISEKSML